MPIYFQTSIVSKTAITGLVLLLAACGGGGGGGGASDTPSANASSGSLQSTQYQPDAALLASDAGSSEELYVEPNFNFDSSTTMHLYVTVKDNTGMEKAEAMISVFEVPSDTASWDSLADVDKQLILKGITNINGVLDVVVDVRSDVQKVLLVANTLGVENQALAQVNNGIVSYHFE